MRATGPLRDARFRRLLAGQTLASFGITALYLALGIWAKALTGSNALAGTVFLALGIPTLFAPLGGQLVDRVRRKPLIVLTNAGLALAVLSLLAVHSRSQLWLIYLVAAATGLAMDISGASRNALLKDMLPAHQLAQANAAVQTLSQGLQLISPLVGAGLYAWLGGGGFALFDVVVLSLAALALATVRVTESQRAVATGERFMTELLAGFRHLRSVPMLLQLSVFAAAAFAVLGLAETVGFAVVDEGLHRPASFYGVVTAVQGGGSLIGGLTVTRLMRPLGESRTVGVSLAVVAAGFIGMISSSVAVVLVGSAVIGLGVPWFIVGWNTALQRYTPPRLQGRVGATGNMMLSVPQTLSIALGASLISVVDYRILLLVIIVGMTGAGLMLLIRPTPAPLTEPIIDVPVGN
ncbi:MAG TPA: MFS transporter [Pseudonocardiaceae bacterium]|nr:MFS transporter [Pseudonocardiaceae bacterium]